MSKLVPKDFQVPEVLETDRLRLRMLTVNDVVKDYDAVMTSIEHLQKTKPFGPGHKWPTKELTFEQDLIDLGWSYNNSITKNIICLYCYGFR